MNDPSSVGSAPKQPFDLSIGEALKYLKMGIRVAREGWNGKGMYLELQKPDTNSKMTRPYVYIVIPGTKSRSSSELTPDEPADLVPWVISQTDLLAEDWFLI